MVNHTSRRACRASGGSSCAPLSVPLPPALYEQVLTGQRRDIRCRPTKTWLALLVGNDDGTSLSPGQLDRLTDRDGIALLNCQLIIGLLRLAQWHVAPLTAVGTGDAINKTITAIDFDGYRFVVSF